VLEPVPLPQPLCWHYRQRGTCAQGDACRFAHASPQGKPASISPASDSPSTPPQYYWLHRMPRNESEWELIVQTLDANGFQRATTPDEEARALLLWSGSSSIPANLKTGVPPLRAIAVNRLGCGAAITQKDRLAASLRMHCMQQLAPRTFVLPAEYKELMRHCKRCSRTDRARPHIWIVKPFSTGCGRGIWVTQDAESQVKPGSKCVVSSYITRPLLVDEVKLDLRIFVLVTTGQRCQRKVFISEHGLVRFASKKFSCEDLRGATGGADECKEGGACGSTGAFDPKVHLTYINSHNRQLHRQQRSKQWTVKQLLAWIAESPSYGPAAAAGFWLAVCQMALRTVQCLPQPALGEQQEGDRTRPFELFGFDVLPDRDLRPWLLEVGPGAPQPRSAAARTSHACVLLYLQVATSLLPSRIISTHCAQVNSQPDLSSTSKNGGRVYPAEHEAKARTIASVLTLALRPTHMMTEPTDGSCGGSESASQQAGSECDTDGELDSIAASLGMERIVFNEEVGLQWWGASEEVDDIGDEDE
jgi:hypothetical protein